MKNWRIPAIITTILFVTVIALWFSFYDKSNSEIKHFRVCIVYSFSENVQEQDDMTEKFRRYFLNYGIDADIRTYYLDCNKYGREEEEERMCHILDDVRSWRPDIFLSVDDQASYTILSVNHPLVRRLPVMFCGVNFPNRKLLATYDNVWGILDEPDYLENARFIDRVLPGAKIELVHDRTALGKIAYKRLLDNVGDKFPLDSTLVKYDTIESYSDIAAIYENQETSRWEGRSYINLFPFRSSNGRLVLQHFNENSRSQKLVFMLDKCDIISVLLAQFYNYPVFSASHKGVNYNNRIVGGYFSSSDDIVDASAKMLRSILVDKKAPYEASVKKKYYADYNVYSKWGLSSSDFPSYTNIINEPWYKRNFTLLFVLAVGCAMAFIVMAIHILFARTRKARNSLIVSSLDNSRNNLMMSVFGGQYVYWALHGDSLYLDHFSNKVFGHRDNVLTLAQFFTIIHPDDRSVVEQLFIDRSKNIVKSAEYRILESSGEYVWHTVNFSIISLNNEDFAVGFVRNSHKEKVGSLRDHIMRADYSDFSMQKVFYYNFRPEIGTLVNYLDFYAHSFTKDVAIPALSLSKIFMLQNRLSALIDNYNSLLVGKVEFSKRVATPYKLLLKLYGECLPQERDGLIITSRVQYDDWAIEVDVSWLVSLMRTISVFFLQFKRASVLVDYFVDESASEPKIEFRFVSSVPTHPVDEMIRAIDSFNYTVDYNSCGCGLEIPYARLLCMRLGGKLSSSSTPVGVNVSLVFPCIKIY